MADNTTLSAGTGDGVVIATDDIAGVHYQINKLAHGALDSATLVSTSSGLPVQQQGTWTVASHAVTNAGTFAVQEDGAALTALQLIDDAVYVDDADWTDGASKHLLVGGLYQSTPQTITDGDVGPLQVDANGNLIITGSVTADLGATDNAVLDSIDGKLTTIDADTSTLAAVDFATGADVASLAVTGGGVEATALRVTIASDSTGVVSVDDNGGALTVDNAGTFAVQAASAGVAAHDAAISGNPVRMAGRALTSDYAAVAAGDTADIITTLLGKLVNVPYANPANTWSYAAASGGITNTTGVTAKAAGGAGVRNYITRVQVINGHATVSTDVQIRDGASGTVLWRGFAQAAGGGVSAVFDPPLRGSAATLVEIACGTTGSATYFNLQGYTAAE